MKQNVLLKIQMEIVVDYLTNVMRIKEIVTAIVIANVVSNVVIIIVKDFQIVHMIVATRPSHVSISI